MRFGCIDGVVMVPKPCRRRVPSRLSASGHPGAALRETQVAALERIGATLHHVTPAIDVDGRYREWLGDRTGIVRPDFYVFGWARQSALPELVDDLLDQILARTTSSTV
jgi:hypothetical protein